MFICVVLYFLLRNNNLNSSVILFLEKRFELIEVIVDYEFSALLWFLQEFLILKMHCILNIDLMAMTNRMNQSKSFHIRHTQTRIRHDEARQGD